MARIVGLIVNPVEKPKKAVKPKKSPKVKEGEKENGK